MGWTETLKQPSGDAAQPPVPARTLAPAQMTPGQVIAAINAGRAAAQISGADNAHAQLQAMVDRLSDPQIAEEVDPVAAVDLLHAAGTVWVGQASWPVLDEAGKETAPFRLSRLLPLPKAWQTWRNDRLERAALTALLDPRLDPVTADPARLPEEAWSSLETDQRKDVVRAFRDGIVDAYGLASDMTTLDFFTEAPDDQGLINMGLNTEGMEYYEVTIGLNDWETGPLARYGQAANTTGHELTHALQSWLAFNVDAFGASDPRATIGRMMGTLPRGSRGVNEAMGWQAYADQWVERDADSAGQRFQRRIQDLSNTPKAELGRMLAAMSYRPGTAAELQNPDATPVAPKETPASAPSPS